MMKILVLSLFWLLVKGQDNVAGSCISGSCPTGYSCVNNLCLSDSNPSVGACIDGQCPSGYQCNAGYCYAIGLESTTAIPYGYGTSEWLTTTSPNMYCVDGQCPSGYYCGWSGLCYPNNDMTTPFPYGYGTSEDYLTTTMSVHCTPDSCPPGYYCGWASFCYPIGDTTTDYPIETTMGTAGACISGQCPSGYYCGQGNLCYLSSCPPGYYCGWASFCYPIGDSTTDDLTETAMGSAGACIRGQCPSGYTCKNSVFVKPGSEDPLVSQTPNVPPDLPAFKADVNLFRNPQLPASTESVPRAIAVFKENAFQIPLLDPALITIPVHLDSVVFLASAFSSTK
ncbi:hypothetical protein FO519_004474 [Halicephalobus sp. NKZ332]|nr:hypothetical protein FO519_004474 [Halicephalobus sp. NKZ332]